MTFDPDRKQRGARAPGLARRDKLVRLIGLGIATDKSHAMLTHDNKPEPAPNTKAMANDVLLRFERTVIYEWLRDQLNEM